MAINRLKIVFLMSVFLPLSLFPQTIDSLLETLNAKTLKEQVKVLSGEAWKYRSKKPLYALAAGRKAYQLSEQLKDNSLLASSSNFIGVIERNLGHFGKALLNYQKALKFSELGGDSLQMAYSYNNIGGIHRMQRQFTLALEKIFKALKIFEGLKNERGIAFCYINLGIIFRERGEYSKALDYLNKTIEIRERLGDKFGITLALSHIAEVHFQKGEYEETYSTYLKLLNSYRKLNDTKGIAYIYGGLSLLLYKKGDYSEALKFRERSLELNRQIMNNEGTIISLCNISRIYNKLGKYKKAKKALDEAKNIMNNTDLVLAPKHYLSALSDYYSAIGNYKKAFNVYLKYVEYNDSLLSAEDEMRFAAIESMYNVEQMNKKNSILQKNLEIKNNQQIFLIVLSIVGALFLIFILYKENRTRNLNAKLKEINQAKDKFYSIIAHDLRNPFNSILGYSDLLINDYDSFTDEERISSIKEINNATIKLYNLVNNLLEWSRGQSVNLKVNLEKFPPFGELRNVIEIFRLVAAKKNIKLEIAGDENVQVLCDGNIFQTVFRNLINNAIKFTHKGGTVTITVKDESKEVEISVEDNGVGIPEEKLNEMFSVSFNNTTAGTEKEQGTGLGLILVKELLDKVGGKIRVESKLNEGSKFIVCLPK